MAYSSTKYQYETSPRKLKPEYERKKTKKSETSRFKKKTSRTRKANGRLSKWI